jgi:signal transduction histidine kinase
MRIAEDWPVEGDVSLAGLSSETLRLLSKARQSLRVTRLDDGSSRTRGEVNRSSCFGLTIRDGGRRTRTCLISADRRRIVPLVSMVRELQSGLQMVFRRIRLAEARAGAARRLAQHVSEELRTPVGALTHAIDRFRGEAKRVGMQTEWVDRVSSESERVARAIEHLEGEMRTDSLGVSRSARRVEI